jgi:hypothetical protein
MSENENMFCRYRGRASKMECQIVISVIWISRVVLSSPMGYAMEVIYIQEEHSHSKPFCYANKLSEHTMILFRTILVLLQYVMPLSVITWAYWNISVALWGNIAPGNAETERDANLMRNKRRVSDFLFQIFSQNPFLSLLGHD